MQTNLIKREGGKKKSITPFVHQQQIMSAPFAYPDISYFMLLGGFGCGKSTALVFLLLMLCKRYVGHEITIAVASTTITLLQKTVVLEFERICKASGSFYRVDRKNGIITVGKIRILLMATAVPKEIYGPNVSVTLCDEIDELPEHLAIEAHRALTERTRIPLPDGRQPFLVYFSTVHGYRGLYKIMQKMKAENVPYVAVRGLTKNNTSLSPVYVQNLYAAYNEQERLAYLEGMFVNLSSGRVYSDYDDASCRCEPFDITKDYTVFIGQDLNSGYSKGVAVVKKDKVLYVARGWSFKEIGGAPAIMRGTYFDNEILWFPDTAGKETIKGYRDEIIANGIECRFGRKNPPILERVFIINKLFKLGRLKIFNVSETDKISEDLKTRGFNDLGMPSKGKGEDAPDHYCFVAGTMIYTARGCIPIEKITTDDYVLTHLGYRQVEACGRTGKKLTIDKFGLTGTSDHPIITKGGVQQLHDAEDYFFLCREDAECVRFLFLMELDITDILTQKDARTANILLQGYATEWQAGLRDYIATYGARVTAKYLRDMMCTILMEIQTITKLTTLSAFQKATILKSITRLSCDTLLQNRICARRQRGTGAKRGLLGTAETAGCSCGSVRPAKNSLKQDAAGKYFAQNPARQNGRGSLLQDVYNLSVKEARTYFANGVLVHNCDALEYVVYRLVNADEDFNEIRCIARDTHRQGSLHME